MRILQFVTQLEPGGAQRVALTLNEGFAARGHEAQLVFLYQKVPMIADGQVLAFTRPSWTEAPALAGRIVATMRSLRPHAVIAHTHYSNTLVLPIAQALGVEQRIAVQHAPADSLPRQARAMDLLAGALGVYTSNIAVSESALASFSHHPALYRGRLVHVPNGVAIDRSRPAEAMRDELAIPVGTPLILHVGRLAAQKNQAQLLRAIARIPRAHVVLVGEGRDRAALEALTRELGIQDRSHLLGARPPRDVHALMRACSVFAFPSVWEAMPLAAMEAMVVGAPIVASRIDSLTDLLHDSALFAEPSSVESLVTALTAALDDPALAARRAEAAKLRAQPFSAEAMVDRYERLLAG